jgi:sodium-dependent phosphate cotransporter
VTVLTQSSTITNSVLVPFAGAGILTPAQIYPVTVGSNLGHHPGRRALAGVKLNSA